MESHNHKINLNPIFINLTKNYLVVNHFIISYAIDSTSPIIVDEIIDYIH